MSYYIIVVVVIVTISKSHRTY